MPGDEIAIQLLNPYQVLRYAVRAHPLPLDVFSLVGAVDRSASGAAGHCRLRRSRCLPASL
jgi:hypothetical protein